MGCYTACTKRFRTTTTRAVGDGLPGSFRKSTATQAAAVWCKLYHQNHSGRPSLKQAPFARKSDHRGTHPWCTWKPAPASGCSDSAEDPLARGCPPAQAVAKHLVDTVPLGWKAHCRAATCRYGDAALAGRSGGLGQRHGRRTAAALRTACHPTAVRQHTLAVATCNPSHLLAVRLSRGWADTRAWALRQQLAKPAVLVSRWTGASAMDLCAAGRGTVRQHAAVCSLPPKTHFSWKRGVPKSGDGKAPLGSEGLRSKQLQAPRTQARIGPALRTQQAVTGGWRTRGVPTTGEPAVLVERLQETPMPWVVCEPAPVAAFHAVHAPCPTPAGTADNGKPR